MCIYMLLIPLIMPLSLAALDPKVEKSIAGIVLTSPAVGVQPSHPILLRFALAAAELNEAIYDVGGYDGKEYARTAERFDPREHSWKQIESMNTKRGCPCMVVLNEKLFVLGGYDGNDMVSTIEIYDPRRGSWMLGEPMNHSRGFAAAVVTKESIYIFGGLKNGEEFNDTVECYKEGRGWEVTDTNDTCRRCFFSTIAM